MSFLKKIGKIAGGAIGGVVGGPVGAKIGSSLIGGLVGSSGAKRAGNASVAGEQAAADEQRAALSTVGGYQQPYREAGGNALVSLNRLNAGDYSGFESSPDFLFAQKYGSQAVDRSAAARGGLNSGNTLAAQQQYGQGLASQQLGNYRNALFQTAGMGQNATNALSSATLGTGANIGNALIGAGDARASGIQGSTNALVSGIDNFSDALGDNYGNSLVKRPPKAKQNSLYGYNVKLPTTQRAV